MICLLVQHICEYVQYNIILITHKDTYFAKHQSMTNNCSRCPLNETYLCDLPMFFTPLADIRITPVCLYRIYWFHLTTDLLKPFRTLHATSREFPGFFWVFILKPVNMHGQKCQSSSIKILIISWMCDEWASRFICLNP